MNRPRWYPRRRTAPRRHGPAPNASPRTGPPPKRAAPCRRPGRTPACAHRGKTAPPPRTRPDALYAARFDQESAFLVWLMMVRSRYGSAVFRTGPHNGPDTLRASADACHHFQSATQPSKPRRSFGRLRLRPMNTMRLVRGSPSFHSLMKSPSAIMCTAWKANRRGSLA